MYGVLDKRTAVGVARPVDLQRVYRSPTCVPNSHASAEPIADKSPETVVRASLMHQNSPAAQDLREAPDSVLQPVDANAALRCSKVNSLSSTPFGQSQHPESPARLLW